MLGLLFFSLFAVVRSEIGCWDGNNEPVDWFIFYKLPANLKANDSTLVHGRKFMYLDSNLKKWHLLENDDFGSENQTVALTLEQYYRNDSEIFKMMYNDVWPGPDNYSADPAMAKGVLAFDSSSGFWLSHSIPQFPPPSTYIFWENVDSHYAHMGLCISFGYKSLRGISDQLHLISPSIYDMNLPDKFAQDFPLLKDLNGKGNYSQTTASFKSAVLRTIGGNRIISFAKSGEFEKDIYADLIVPSLGVSLEVQSELNRDKSNNLPSSCEGRLQVRNIASTKTPFDQEFSTSKDHSKFAVAAKFNNKKQILTPWVCIGSIDRQIFQLSRGGGALCLMDPMVWNTFLQMVEQTLPCDEN